MQGDEPITLGSTSQIVGKSCPFCEEQFIVGDEVVVCPRCKQPHHAACWQEHGGCTSLGCPQLASTAPAKKERITDDDRAKEYIKPLPKWVPWTLVVVGLFVVFGIPLLRKTVFADKRPKVTIMVPALEDLPVIQTAVNEFAASRPDLQVELIAAAYGDGGSLYETKLTVMIGARDAPDVFVLPWAKFVAYAQRGVFADITEWVSSEPEALAHVPPERLEKGAVDGVVYGVPHPGRSAFFGIFRYSERIPEALALLEHVIASIPAEDDVYDEFRVETVLPVIPFVPGF